MHPIPNSVKGRRCIPVPREREKGGNHGQTLGNADRDILRRPEQSDALAVGLKSNWLSLRYQMTHARSGTENKPIGLDVVNAYSFLLSLVPVGTLSVVGRLTP